MTTVNHELPTKKAQSLNKLPILFVFVGLAVIAGWSLYHAIPVWQAATSLLAIQEDAEALLADGLVNIDADNAEELVERIHSDVETLNEHLGPLLPITSKLRWLPEVGALLAAAPELMSMADAGTDTALYAFKGLKPALIVMQDKDLEGKEKIAAIAGILAEAEPELLQTSSSFDKVIEARNNIRNFDALPWRIRTLLERFDREVPLGTAAFKLAPVIPYLAGRSGPKNYLILVQNEDELRATGGYISGAGLLTVQNGRIESLLFEDAYTVDDWENKPYDFPPPPIKEFMSSELFLFRDANFWPDFSTSAKQAMRLYTYGRDVPLDGVIALDQNFLRILLQALGPVYVAELDRQISADNFVEQIRTEWEPEEGDDFTWLASRKDFMAPLANSLITRLLNDFETLDLYLLANSLLSAAEERHLQLFFNDPKIGSTINELNWAARQPPEGTTDFLQIIDTNMGFNKVNAVIKREIEYDIILDQDGTANATVEVTYANGGESDDECRQGGASYAAGEISYSGLVNDCYWNYLRIYTPSGSELISASEHPLSNKQLLSTLKWNGEARVESEANSLVTTYANFILVKPQETVTVIFNYKLPSETLERTQEGLEYRLLVQKQPGTLENPLQVRVSLPPDMVLVKADPLPAEIDGDVLIYETALRRDQQIKLLLSERPGSEIEK